MSDIKQTKAAMYLEFINKAMIMDAENRRLREVIASMAGDIFRYAKRINELEALIPDAGKMEEEKPE